MNNKLVTAGLIVLSFSAGLYMNPEEVVITEKETVTETQVVNNTVYEDRKYPFEPVNNLLDYSYDSDRNRLVIRKTGMRELEYGDSMQPSIWTGNKYLTSHYNGNTEIEPGMVVGIRQPDLNELWVHRVTEVDREEGLVWTQGDNNEDGELGKLKHIEYIVTGVLFTDKDTDSIENDYSGTWKDR